MILDGVALCASSVRAHVAAVSVLRALTIIALIAALMQPVWTASMRQVSVVYALDVSRSVASGFVHSAMQFIDKANREAAPAHARYVVFADGRAHCSLAAGTRADQPDRGEQCRSAPSEPGRDQP
jgi:hypothetical protein